MFQFTHPGRGATTYEIARCTDIRVSIHAPREGCDCQIIGVLIAPLVFQFTHPGRGATFVSGGQIKHIFPFQFTHPGRGATGNINL